MGLKMLIADDEADLVDVLRDRLEAYGFTVITAGTGRGALEKLATEPVDGIFLDVKMPDLDGLAALDEIRRRDSQTPIIILYQEQQQCLARAVAQLPPDLRLVVEAAYEAIASRLGCTVGTVQARLGRAWRRLRAALVRVGQGPGPL
jgi:CheY-like chemotaxis protein